MAPKIKLQRVGAKNQPKFRIVVQEERSKLNGAVIEILGQYDPRKEPSLFEFNKELMESWLKKGAQPTEKVRILLGKAGILPAIDLASLTKRKPRAQAKSEAAAAPAETAKPEEGKKEAPAEKAEKSEAEIAPQEAKS